MFLVIKLFSVPFLALLVSSGAVAQAATSASDAGGLIVISQKWHRELRDSRLERDPVEETNDRMDQERRRRDVEQTNDTRRALGMPTLEVPTPELKNDTEPSREATASYVYEVKLRNASGKDISSITWEYVFLEIDSDKEVGRRRFESNEPIARGKTRDLVMRSAVPPTGTIDASKANIKTSEKYSQKIVILSVEYSDGSKWPANSD
jgi:hypothetical protein